jgi:hypothetical protein
LAVPAAQSNSSVLVPLKVRARSVYSPGAMPIVREEALTFCRIFSAKPLFVSVTTPPGELLLKIATSAAVGSRL